MIGRCAAFLAGWSASGTPLSPAQTTARATLRDARIDDGDADWRRRGAAGDGDPVAALRADLLAHPDDAGYDLDVDNSLRLAFASLIEATDHNRAELIRLQTGVGAATSSSPARRAARVRELLGHHGRGWSAVNDLVAASRFYRGWVGHVTVGARELLERGERLFALEPITELALRGGVREQLDEVLASPLLRRLRALDLAGQGLGDAAIARLAASPNLGNLVALNLDGNRLTIAGLRAIAWSDTLRRLRLGSFAGNLDDLTADASGGELPPLAEQLEEEQARRIPWLHSGSSWADHEALAVSRPPREDDDGAG